MMPIASIKLSHKKQWYLLLVAWLAVQAILFAFLDVRPVLESTKYIRAAAHLAQTGTLPESRYLFYAMTTFVIALAIKLKVGFGAVVVFQLGLNLFATWSFYNALHKTARSASAAFYTTLLLIFFIPYQSWNFYLYTESIFYSCLLLFVSSCIYPAKSFFLQAFFLALAVLSRPLGILLLPAWLVYLIATNNKKRRLILYGALALSMLLFAAVANHILGSINDWQILQSAENNSVICDVPVGNVNDYHHLKTRTPLLQLGGYIFQYPASFALLALKRLAAFFFLYRSYYSPLHNAALIAAALLLYFPFVKNIAFSKSLKPPRLLAAAIIFLFAASVALQCDDYHNRFYLAIVPVFLYAGFFNFLDQKAPAKAHPHLSNPMHPIS